ncbi:MAG UNVERIFIED_CONTAM: hypothetical protein LVQ98_06140 [Rickettsiaceae bacterium]
MNLKKKKMNYKELALEMREKIIFALSCIFATQCKQKCFSIYQLGKK